MAVVRTGAWATSSRPLSLGAAADAARMAQGLLGRGRL